MEKRIIPACLINNQLKSLIEEVESHDIYNNFKIKCLNKDDFFKVKSSFVMMDEDIDQLASEMSNVDDDEEVMEYILVKYISSNTITYTLEVSRMQSDCYLISI